MLPTIALLRLAAFGWAVLPVNLAAIAQAPVDDGACSAQGWPSSSGRQDKERCLLQHAATKVVNQRGASVGGAESEGIVRRKAPSEDIPISAISPYSNPAEVTAVLGEMSLHKSEPPDAWEADYLVDDQPGRSHGVEDVPAAEEFASHSRKPSFERKEEQAESRQEEQSKNRDTAKWSALVELHIPVRLRDVHNGRDGPLSKFVRSLRQKLQVAVGVPLERIVMLGVRGEYMKLDANQISLLEHRGNHIAALLEGVSEPDPFEGGPNQAFDCKAGADLWVTGWSESKKAWCCKTEGIACSKETIVDVEVLPRSSPSEPSASQVISTWAAQLRDDRSALRRGALSALLERATLTSSGKSLVPKVYEPEPESEPSRSGSFTWNLGVSLACGQALLQGIAAGQ